MKASSTLVALALNLKKHTSPSGCLNSTLLTVIPVLGSHFDFEYYVFLETNKHSDKAVHMSLSKTRINSDVTVNSFGQLLDERFELPRQDRKLREHTFRNIP